MDEKGLAPKLSADDVEIGGKGKAAFVIEPTGDHSFTLNEEVLERVLLQNHCKDKYVSVVSVAGAFRKGKSFLLDFFIRYLRAQGSPDWLGDGDSPLTGFSWRGGAERETTGIHLWDEVFTMKLPNGEETCIILMDTQGAFDSQSTVRDCATIFALSTMLSSIQIYNLTQNIQEDDLQHLQLFTEYGRLALEDCGERPFQRLHFLVRDWSYPYEAAYGIEGGKKILDRRLQISDKQHEELQKLRKHISSCFSKIDCFLMPHPGLKVATDPNFCGCLTDIDEEFQRQLKELVPMLLSPKNMILKEIGGRKIKCKELLHYFKAYIEIYKGGELPEPKTMLEATAEANNLSAVNAARELYMSLMDCVCGGERPYMNQEQLTNEHLRIRDRAIETFQSTRKMGGAEFSEMYQVMLEKEVDDMFEKYKAHNESKNIFKAARTPAILFVVAMVMYVFSTAFNLLGLNMLLAMANTVMGVAFIALALWAYARYSGEARDVGIMVDSTANVLWDKALKPVYKKVVDSGTERAAVSAIHRGISNVTANAAASALKGDRVKQS
ncbi:unnamed protein product [Darwinula stevensoni]|uniref:GB1/RHD3-type G domain-containing protein n=1 Tax=Darwinula stevensoni TaxID=69355 RepID=A0A7R8X934_9CRUS|nr:unnamed protein product [Darwinula stevensoni]CAG0883977.1 unnamed protein product [Darwinula stevensoni]